MLGPHYEKLAEVEQKFTSQQIFTRLQARPSNPLTSIIDRLKKEFANYECGYTDDVINPKISSIDRILSFDAKLGPIFSGLQSENNLLRKNLSVMEGQLSNTLSILESVLSQNNELKLMIQNKNGDIAKIIETIARNQSQVRNELEDKLALLQEENSILLRHLDNLKKQHESYGEHFNAKDVEISSWRRKWEECKKHLTDNLSRQHQLSRKLSVIEQNLYEQTEQLYELQQQHQTLTFENSEMKNQLLVLHERGGKETVDQLKQKMRQEQERFMGQQRMLKNERQQFLREAEQLKIDRQRNIVHIDELQKQLNKAVNNLQLTTSLLNEQRSRNAQLSSSLNKMEQKIAEIKEENSRLRSDMESGNSYWVAREKSLQKDAEELRRNLHGQAAEWEGRLKDIREKTRSLLDAKQMEMHSLNETNNQLRRALQRVQPQH